MATPTLAFLAATQLWSLRTSVGCAIAGALAVLAVRRAQRRSLAHALAGVGIVPPCAVGAAVTDEARGLFLVPALVPRVVRSAIGGSARPRANRRGRASLTRP